MKDPRTEWTGRQLQRIVAFGIKGPGSSGGLEFSCVKGYGVAYPWFGNDSTGSIFSKGLP